MQLHSCIGRHGCRRYGLTTLVADTFNLDSRWKGIQWFVPTGDVFYFRVGTEVAVNCSPYKPAR